MPFVVSKKRPNTTEVEVRQLFYRRGLDIQTIARRTGLDLACVEAILHGKPWRHLTNRAVGDLFLKKM